MGKAHIQGVRVRVNYTDDSGAALQVEGRALADFAPSDDHDCFVIQDNRGHQHVVYANEDEYEVLGYAKESK